MQETVQASPTTGLATLDIVGLALVAVLVLLGIWRGLWWQVIRLLGLVAAVVLARTLSPAFQTWIATHWPELPPRLSYGLAWILLFLGALSVAALLGLLGNRLLEAMQLGLANRVGGGLMGAATGFLLHVALLVAICQLAPEPFVGRVLAGTYSEQVVDAVGRRWEVVLGEDASREVHRLLGQGTVEPGTLDGTPITPDALDASSEPQGDPGGQADPGPEGTELDAPGEDR